jgi:histidinol-phosphate aminotransferase
MKPRFNANPFLSRIEPYSTGSLAETRAPIQMASNENCLGPSPHALKAIEEAMKHVHRYPEATGVELRTAIASRLKVKEEQVILGNGSTELVEMLLRAYLEHGQKSLTAAQTFIIYRIATVAASGECVEVPLRDFRYDLPAMQNAVSDDTRVVLIANPNNPTATMNSSDELGAFLSTIPSNVVVVLDEAYYEYVMEPDYPDGIQMMREFPNVIVLRSFSKIHGLAGLRIGYGVAAEEIISTLNRIRSAYNTNSIAQVAALAALEDEEHIRVSRETAKQERAFLESEFRAQKISYVPSVANFFFLPMQNAPAIQQGLLKHGIFVRAFPTGLRVALGTHEENIAFLGALAVKKES